MEIHELSEFAPSVLILCMMLFLATVMQIGVQKCHFPFTIGLVLAGLVVGIVADWLPFFDIGEIGADITLSHGLILYILLPPLVYEASLAIDLRLLKRNLAPIMLLAVVGLLISTLIVGFMLNWLTPLALMPALVFGALISATDPVAVIALFKELKAPERLSLLMDGESLFNDATAIVMFQVLLGMMAATTVSDGVYFDAVVEFVKVFFGGALVGVGVGMLTSMVAALQPGNREVQISLSVVAAWGSFGLADHFLGLSGVMSCVAAGLVCGYYARTQLGMRTLVFAKRWWGFATFIANSYVFLLLGLKEELLIRSHVANIFGLLVAAIGVVLFARLVVIYGLIPLYNQGIKRFARRKQVISKAYQFIMFWGGLRGAVPMALVLSLPEDFPQRGLLLNMTLAVILWTLLAQGITMKAACRRLLSYK